MDRRVIWALGTTAIFLIFFKWMPLPFYASAPIILSFIGALVFGFFVFRLLVDTLNGPNKSKGIGFFTLIAVPLITVAMAMMFYFNFHLRQKDYLVDKGVITEGVVLEKETFKLKGEKKYRIKIKFEDKKGKKYTSRKDLESMEFTTLKEDGPIKIIYAPDEPLIHDLVISTTAFRQYERAVKEIK